MESQRALLLAWLLLATSDSRAADVALEWRLVPEQVLEEGLEVLWRVGDETPIRNSLRVWTTWVAAKRGPDGTVRVNGRIDRIQSREEAPDLEPLEHDFTGPLAEGKKPSSAFATLAGAKCHFLLTPRGVVDSFEIDEESVGGTHGEDPQKVHTLTAMAKIWFFVFPPLPSGPCREGANWEHEVEPFDTTRMRQRIRCEYQGLAKKGGREHHLIQTTSRFSSAEPGGGDVQTIDSLGELHFDAELQRMVERTERSRLRVDGPGGETTIEFEVRAWLREKEVVSGGTENEPAVSPDEAREAYELTRQGKALLQRARREEARESIERAIGIYRRLIASRKDTDLDEHLAWSLSLLAKIEWQESTLPLYEEIAGIYRRLIHERGLKRYEPDLAWSLTELGYAQSSLRHGRGNAGRTIDAHRSFSEAVDVYRRLAGPTAEEEILQAFARALDGRASERMNGGKYAEAAEDHGERVAIYRRLIDEKARKQLERELAQALGDRGDALVRAQEYKKALHDLDAAIAITSHIEEVEERKTPSGVYTPLRTTDIDLHARTFRARALISLQKFDLAVVDLDVIELYAPLDRGDHSMIGVYVEEGRNLKHLLCENNWLPPDKPPEERSTESWFEQLDSGDRAKRLQALGALRALEVERRVPALARAFRNPDSLVRDIAIRELGRLGSLARAAVPALIEALEDRNFAAVEALGQIGPEARDALPALEKLRSRFRGTMAEKLVTETIEKIRSDSR